MDPVRNTVSYCCIWKDGRILYNYSIGNQEVDKLASYCLEAIPPYHQWYFETISRNTFAFFMDEGFIYFVIVRESLGNPEVLRFLQKLRDEFRKDSRISFTSLDSLCLHERMLPVVNNLVASLERASRSDTVWPAENPSPCNNANGHVASTKAPLLGKPSKAEKKKMKDHAIVMRDIEMEEHRRSTSTDRGVRIDSGPLDSDKQGTTSASPLHPKSKANLRKKWCRQHVVCSGREPTLVGPTRQTHPSGVSLIYGRSGVAGPDQANSPESSKSKLQKKWCRQVRIVLAIDSAILVVLLVIWLVICRGIKCIR